MQSAPQSTVKFIRALGISPLSTLMKYAVLPQLIPVLPVVPKIHVYQSIPPNC